MPRLDPSVMAQAYGSYLNGKDVAIVGPSGGYAGLGKGGLIDGFDVVVRLNWGSPVPEAHKVDLGSRTDVLYKRLLGRAFPNQAEIKTWLKDGVKWVVVSDPNERSPNVRRWSGMVQDMVSWTLTGLTRTELIKETKTSPLIGVMAVAHLLKYGIRSLTVMNCDFYTGGYQAGYGGVEYRASMGRQEGTIAQSHEAVSQLTWLHKMKAKDSRLSFDEKLTEMAKTAARRGTAVDAVAIIPARYESSRFPGKPLALIHGKPMIVHVCERAAEALEHVLVATDDDRIASVVREHGFEVVMTKPALTGTDRVAEAARTVKAKYIVNVQGDEPLIEPEDILAVLDAKRADPKAIANGMCRLTGDPEDRTAVKAAVSADGYLVYASRAPVPAAKEGHQAQWKQLGLYAFDPAELELFSSYGRRGAVEAAEDVEMLRFLEMGKRIRMVQVSETQAVDLPEHIALVERLMDEAVPA